MEEADLSQVAELEKEIFSQPWSLASFQNDINNEENIYLVAEEAEKIIGYCCMWCVAGEGQIYNVAVHPACRKRHVGKTLMQALLAQGEQRGLTAFTLEVRVGNQPAIHLYETLGFENAGIRKNFYDLPKEDAMIMWLYHSYTGS